MSEGDLYEPVRKWLEGDLGPRCAATWTNKGPQEARPDVTGLRHVGGNLRGDFELITVEVKNSSARFVTSAGQAGAYGLYADRTYLCCSLADGGFDEDQVEVASHLGIGLLTIDDRHRVSRVLAAPVRHPIARKRLLLLEGLGYVVCQICDSPFPSSQDHESVNRKGWTGLVRSDTKSVADAVDAEKGYAWWLWNWSNDFGRLDADDTTRDHRYLCRDCVAALFWDLRTPDGEGS